MSLKQNGLSRRLSIEARRISSQHRQLDELYGMLVGALRDGRAGVVERSFERFRDAAQAHFTMEDDIHFPAFHGLHPELEAPLTELVEEHRAMRREFAVVGSLFRNGELDAGAEELDRLIVRLARHEEREETLLVGLQPPG